MTAAFEDKCAIQELIARYSHAIDSRNYAAWVNCFAEDGAFEGSRSGQFVGHAALKAFTEQFEARRDTEYPNVRHCVMNSVIDVEGETARSDSYLQVLITNKKGTTFAFCGRYDDTFVKVDGAWRFRERKVLRDERPA
jgi:3-phenylpropionate/cinnamic acid dioxygenase small subunit